MSSVIDKINEVAHYIMHRELWAAYFLITRLGYPRINNDIETACVSTSLENKRMSKLVNFQFNKEFMDSLRIEELAAVLLHESFHILFNHTTSTYGNANPHLWNLACDAVINDMIDLSYSKDITLPKEKITGEWLVGENCADKTAEWVYDKVIEKAIPISVLFSKTTMDDHRIWKTIAATMGQDRFDELTKAINKIMQDAYDANDKIFNKGGKNAGHDPLGAGRQVKLVRPKLTPQELMRRIVSKFSSALIQPSWVPANKKLIMSYPKIILPTWESISKPKVLFSVDTSGSITAQWLNCFISICMAARNYVIPDYTSFDTEIYKWIPGSPTVRGGGGTDITPIERYASQQHQYPEYVIVMTDGYFYGCEITHPERWIFIIEGYGDDNMQNARFRYYGIPKESEIIFLPKG